MELNYEMRCSIETLFNRVIDFNERVNSEAVLKIEKKGVVLHVDSNYWTREDRCLHIWAETEEDLKSMIQWLDTELAIAEKDKEDPRVEAQKELDKEQI
jgi:hypothetical protein